MNEGVRALFEKGHWLLRGLRKRRWLALAVAWGTALLCAVVVPIAPQRYEASARIYVDTQTVLKPLMAGLAFQPDIDQQVRMLAKTLISRPNVERLLDQPGFQWQHGSSGREAEITRLMDQIKVVSTGAGNLYSITYRDPDPARARRLVEGTVELFVAQSAGGKKRDSEDASKFINEQISAYEGKLVESENRLKDFKMKHFGLSGVPSQDYFVRMSALSDEVTKLTVQLRAAEQSRDAYRRELNAEEPQLPLDAPGAGGALVLSESDARLESLHKQLDDLLRRYTDQHPDVVSVRRSIAQVEQQKRDEQAARGRGSQGRGPAATSPVYQKIRVSLAEAESQVASLRAQLGAQQAQLADVRALASRVPQVEAEYAQLNRDYDIIRKNYDQLVARRESASLGLKLDESSQLADFRVVEPPRVSPSAVFPNRLHMVGLSVLLTLLMSLGSVLVAETLQPTVDHAAALEKLIGRKVIGAVSVSRSLAALQEQAVQARRYLAGCAGLLVMMTAWFGWIAWRAVS